MGQAAKINPFPCSEHGLCQFAAWLAGQKLQQYISWKVLAIISLHSLPMLEYLLGITLMNSCLPITPYNFMETTCVCSLQPESLDHIMLWAACLHNVFLWFSYIWESYFSQTSIWWKTHLAFGDITLDSCSSPKLVKIKIKASKTDPLWQGSQIFLDVSLTREYHAAGVTKGESAVFWRAYLSHGWAHLLARFSAKCSCSC